MKKLLMLLIGLSINASDRIAPTTPTTPDGTMYLDLRGIRGSKPTTEFKILKIS